MAEQNVSHETKGLVPYWVKAVIVFTFGWIALYATRTILNPIMDNIQVDFGLSNSQLGLIMSIFFLGYAGLNVPSGILGDKFGKKRILVPGVILFGAFAIITGMMPTFFLFMATWLMVGIFQGSITVLSMVCPLKQFRLSVSHSEVPSLTVVWHLVPQLVTTFRLTQLTCGVWTGEHHFTSLVSSLF
ncbi:putative sulfoacetate transporter SauU [Lentibacillus sp. JNUCC-1]|nr:putative sulfoacetate transporter SauU [Lentibacillus sp. JNUCC-1]